MSARRCGRCSVFLRIIPLAMLLPLFATGSLQGNTVVRGGSGIKIGSSDRSTASRGQGIGRSSSGVKIGEGRLLNSTRTRVFPTTTTTTSTTTPPPPPKRSTHPPASARGNNNDNVTNITYLKVGLMVPYKSFGVREYAKAVTTAVNTLQKSTRGPRLGLFQHYDIHVRIAMKELTPSPTGER